MKVATTNGSTVVFKENKVVLIARDGTRFYIYVYGRLDYLHTEIESNDDKCNASHDIQAGHEILGHYNYDDVLRLQDVVDGTQIKGKISRQSKGSLTADMHRPCRSSSYRVTRWIQICAIIH